MTDGIIELARRIVLRDGPKITEGGYAAEYMTRELRDLGFFDGCDTLFEYSVWSDKMQLRNSYVPKNQYLVMTSPLTPYSSVNSPVFSHFQKNDMCLYEYKYQVDIEG